MKLSLCLQISRQGDLLEHHQLLEILGLLAYRAVLLVLVVLVCHQLRLVLVVQLVLVVRSLLCLPHLLLCHRILGLLGVLVVLVILGYRRLLVVRPLQFFPRTKGTNFQGLISYLWLTPRKVAASMLQGNLSELTGHADLSIS